MKISISLSRELVARIDRAARAEARPRSRVLEDWLRTTARENAARDLEEATIAYHGALPAARSCGKAEPAHTVFVHGVGMPYNCTVRRLYG